MQNAQEQALALLAGQRGLLGPGELSEAQETARAHSVSLAEVLVAGQRISPQGAAALMEELAARDWVCQSCGSTLNWSGLALLAALRCPGCGGALAPRARPPGKLAQSLSSGTGQVELGEARRTGVGPYVKVRELGRGSNGVVWLAEKPGLGRQFALKVLHESELGDEESVARFKLEAAIASKLDETGVIGVYDIGKDGRSWYYAMEYCPGETLEARIGRGALPPTEAAEILAALARTMEQAHQQGVIHRDLKPANVIIDARTGKPRITDFGLAKDPSLLRDMTRSGDVLGTPYYMAPEQLAAEAGIDHRIDIYAMGVLLYESLCGQRPYKAQNFAELAARVKKHPPPPLRDRAPAVPEPLAAICAQAMARKKPERYARAADLADDLERWLRGEVPRAVSSPSAQIGVPRRPRLVVLLPLLALAALLGGAAGAGLVIARREPESPPPPEAPGEPAPTPQPLADGAGARAHLKRAETLDREGVSAPRVLAELALAFDRAEGDEALRMEVRARRGAFALRRGQPELAREEGRALREARASTPEQKLEGQWLVAQALVRLGRDDEALNELDDLAHRDPDGPRGATAAAMRHRMVQDPGRLALDRLDRALARDPRFVAALVERSAVLLELGRPLGEVEAALALAGQVDPDDPRVLLGTATLRLLSGSPPDAVLTPVERALRLSDPEADPEALRIRARLRILLEQRQAADEDLRRLLELRPQDPVGRVLRGILAWLARQPAKAAEDWTAAWIADASQVASELAFLPRELSDEIRERLGLLEGESAIVPPRLEVSPSLRARLDKRAAAAGPAAGPLLDALVGAAEGRPWRELVAAFARAEEADPLSSVVALERATVLAGREMFDPALGAVRRARELGADGATCDRLEGDVWHRRGKRYKAVEAWDKAARRDDSVEALCAAAKSTYLRAGRREDPAFDDLVQRALARDPDHVPTLMLAAWMVDPRVESGERLIEMQRRIVDLQGLLDCGVLELDYLRLVIDALREQGGGGKDGRTLQLRFDDARLAQMIGLQERWGTLSRGAGPLVRAGESALMGAQSAPEAVRRRLMRRAVRLMQEAKDREPDRGEVWMWLGFLELVRGGEREAVLTNWRRAMQVEPLIQLRPDWAAAYGERFKETASLEALKIKVDPDAPPPEEEPR